MLSSSSKTTRFFGLRRTSRRFLETASLVLMSRVGFSLRSVVESLTKSGECVLAVLMRLGVFKDVDEGR